MKKDIEELDAQALVSSIVTIVILVVCVLYLISDHANAFGG